MKLPEEKSSNYYGEQLRAGVELNRAKRAVKSFGYTNELAASRSVMAALAVKIKKIKSSLEFLVLLFSYAQFGFASGQDKRTKKLAPITSLVNICYRYSVNATHLQRKSFLRHEAQRNDAKRLQRKAGNSS